MSLFLQQTVCIYSQSFFIYIHSFYDFQDCGEHETSLSHDYCPTIAFVSTKKNIFNILRKFCILRNLRIIYPL